MQEPSPEDMIPIRRGYLIGIKQYLGTQRIDECVAAWSWCEAAIRAYDESNLRAYDEPAPDDDTEPNPGA